MSSPINIIFVTLICGVISLPLCGQDCRFLATASESELTNYLQHPDSADCVNVAFERIAAQSPEKSLPTLIDYLGYKRPLNDGEKHGIYMHGPNPAALYPAVHELFNLGDIAIRPLIDFLAEDKENESIKATNARYTLLLIYHGDAVAVIRELVTESQAPTRDVTQRARLRAVAASISKMCPEASRANCEEVLK